VIGAIASGFWYLAYLYLTVPDVRPLATVNPKTTAFIDRRVDEARQDGRELKIRQRWVAYGRISPNLTRAVLTAEDSAFWQHEGIDLDALRESMEYNLERMEFARGASTITQQLAKNLYLSPSKNPVRKLRELMIARRLEAVLSKRRILEIYLNVVEWGDGVFGAEAAARAYFGGPASGLGPEQAALLAGALINPRLLDPGHPPARLLRRQRMLLRRMGRVTAPPDTGDAGRAEQRPAGRAAGAPTGTVPEAAPPAREEPGVNPDSPPAAPPDPPGGEGTTPTVVPGNRGGG
jgi:monofunctional biosynthetic peptidoglycan transglycosylase